MKVLLDTPPEVARRAREAIMAKSPGYRIRMGAELTDMMFSFVRANLRSQGFTGNKLNAEFVMRMYGRDMSEEERKKLYDRILASKEPENGEMQGGCCKRK